MNKQIAKQVLLSNANACYNAVKENGWQSEMLKESIDNIVDEIEPDHPKVKMPSEVGEDLEDWLAVDNVDDILHDLTSDLTPPHDDGHEAVHRWWNSTLGATYLIADMARYGWEPEPEERFYVEAPENWNAAVGQEYRWVSMCDGEFNLTVKGQSQTFTRAQIKEYRLDSDIFTLVPVEDEK